MADRYWVGGSGNWSDNTNHWSASSGGAPGASLPTLVDSVFFDSASHTTDYTVTIDATDKNCNDITFAAPASGNVTWAGSSTVMNINGSMTLYAGLVRTFTGPIDFEATISGQTITTAGVVMANSISFRGVGGEWTLSDGFNNGSSAITQFRGSLDTNGFTVTCGVFTSSNTNTRTLTLGASTINCSAFVMSTTTGLTFDAGTSTINASSTSAVLFNVGALTFNNVTLATTAFTQACAISGDITIGGTFTCTGTLNTGRLLVDSNSLSAVRTITAAAVSLTNVDFFNITGAGAATWTGTSIGDCGGNSGITFDTPIDCYWVHGASGSYDLSNPVRWFTTSGGATPARVPLPQDTGIFDANSFSSTGKTVAVGTTSLRIGGLNWSGATNSPTFSTNANASIFGSLIMESGVTNNGNNTFTLRNETGTIDLTSAGISWSAGFTLVGSGAFRLTDAFSGASARTFTLSRGTFQTQDFDMSIGLFNSNASQPRTLTLGTSTISLTGAGNVLDFNTITNLTLTSSDYQFVLTGTSASTKTIRGGGATFNKVNLQGVSAGAYIIIGSNTFGTFTASAPNTIQWTDGTTNTFSNFNVRGSVGNIITMQSTLGGSYSFVKATGTGIVGYCDYLSIEDCQATSAVNTWFAGPHSTDVGSNTGWIFRYPYPITAGMFNTFM